MNALASLALLAVLALVGLTPSTDPGPRMSEPSALAGPLPTVQASWRFNDLAVPAEVGPGPIVAFGDSYTAGYGAADGESYPDLLAANLGLVVLNRGISGQTAAEALPRLQAEVIDLRPRLVIVEFGANEAFRGQPVSTCIEALDLILAQLRSQGIPVLLVGVHAAAFQGDFDDALAALAAKHDAAVVLDVLAGILDDSRSVAADGYHPNGAGYGIMESRIRPQVEHLLLDPGLGIVPEDGLDGRAEET